MLFSLPILDSLHLLYSLPLFYSSNMLYSLANKIPYLCSMHCSCSFLSNYLFLLYINFLADAVLLAYIKVLANDL